jgi:hypothetical protein
MKKSLLFSIGRFLIRILAIEMAVLIFTAAICWFGGWRTLPEFENSIVYAGILAMIVGASSMLDATRLARDPTIRYIQTVSSAELYNRTKRHMLDLAESNAFLILMGIVGIISIALGTWLQTFRE